jgi:hypothetical protein
MRLPVRPGGSSRFLFPQASLPWHRFLLWYIIDSTSGLSVLENQNEVGTSGRSSLINFIFKAVFLNMKLLQE